jgi:branched-chain amino acid transport system ATP-binding protein
LRAHGEASGDRAGRGGQVLAVENLEVVYEDVILVLKGVSLQVPDGSIVALLGANGAGKSTLVKILTGAVRPDGGTIRLRGKDRAVHSPAEARRILGLRAP